MVATAIAQWLREPCLSLKSGREKNWPKIFVRLLMFSLNRTDVKDPKRRWSQTPLVPNAAGPKRCWSNLESRVAGPPPEPRSECTRHRIASHRIASHAAMPEEGACMLRWQLSPARSSCMLWGRDLENIPRKKSRVPPEKALLFRPLIQRYPVPQLRGVFRHF